MSETESGSAAEPPAPVLYITDLTYDRFDPADLFDLAFLLRSPEHDLRGVCLSRPEGDGSRVLDALSVAASSADVPLLAGEDDLKAAVEQAPPGVNLVFVGGYEVGARLLRSQRDLLREKGARLFVVGGHVNDYAQGRAGERLPIDPRLKERNPERFAVPGDPRGSGEEAADWATVLTSGEGVIWLPRDICLWRYSAPSLLTDGGPLAEFLLRELFWANLRDGRADRYDAASAPALLSALPALLLAVRPDPFLWMRLFRAMTIRLETDEAGRITHVATRTDSPNLYAVIAIDGEALGKMLTPRLRDRPRRLPSA